MKDLLERAGFNEYERLTLSALCDGPKTCLSLKAEMGWRHSVTANSTLGRIGRKLDREIQRSTAAGSPMRSWRDPDAGWYHVAAPGRRERDGLFYWCLWKQILDAVVALGWHTPRHAPGRPSGKPKPGVEGAEVLYERTVPERAEGLRRQCIEAQGHACLICKADLGAIYGRLGEGFIEVHHLRPLGDGKGERGTDPTKDLIPVCPNCHAMIHRGGTTRTPAEVRRALRRG
jgi:predicted HNH restriction endonuclease